MPKREVDTLADIGLVLTDYVEGLDAANGKIEATDCILRKAEAKAAETVEPECSEQPPLQSIATQKEPLS